MSMFEKIESSAESGMEFTAKQLEAQEAMKENAVEHEGTKDAAEKGEPDWYKLAERELGENGESDTYRSLLAKARGMAEADPELGGWYAGRTPGEWKNEAKKAYARGDKRAYDKYMDFAIKAENG